MVSLCLAWLAAPGCKSAVDGPGQRKRLPAPTSAYQRLTVAEPVRAVSPPAGALRPDKSALDQHLHTLDKARLEQSVCLRR